MAVRLFATDLDGTCIHSSGEISRENLDALARAVAAGCFVTPATGRSFYEMPEVLRVEKPYTHCICSNGATLYDAAGNCIWKSCFAPELVRALLAILSEYDTMIEVYTGGVPVTDAAKLNAASYDHYRIEPIYRPVITKTRKGVAALPAFLASRANRAEMFNVFFRDLKEREEAFSRLQTLSSVELTTSMPNNMEILQKGVNKGATLSRLQRHLGLERAETAAIGDSRNDLTLLSAAGVPLAVANACDALKEEAVAVLCSNNENAVAEAIKTYVLGGGAQDARTKQNSLLEHRPIGLHPARK